MYSNIIAQESNDYSSIILKLLGDHLAEVCVQYLYEYIGQELWIYVPNENLSIKDLLSIKYQDIRLVAEAIEIEVTESLAMQPSSAVSGLYIVHPE
ncbi:unnamed protein product [Rotaria sordida]|uniref:AdoMet activation domain-containing protein n=2 Tax=Rotaria sordida TaxID=392033 RepID=A0A814XNH2_9BILA|nr:unnamed protein product [Rotaria sordida]CAF1216941.1 unnamed protein product [Rotaria sordida]CAF1244833.1 unnamed protein product [Rotaria sordida]CAF1377265.1 unnamed protein product [Rotaria sordida]CAF3685745.1 unnamed protein product [Rotaria sordida]